MFSSNRNLTEELVHVLWGQIGCLRTINKFITQEDLPFYYRRSVFEIVFLERIVSICFLEGDHWDKVS